MEPKRKRTIQGMPAAGHSESGAGGRSLRRHSGLVAREATTKLHRYPELESPTDRPPADGDGHARAESQSEVDTDGVPRESGEYPHSKMLNRKSEPYRISAPEHHDHVAVPQLSDEGERDRKRRRQRLASISDAAPPMREPRRRDPRRD